VTDPRSSRLVELEATRGVAAIVVVAYHLFLSFWLKPMTQLFGTPLFAFVNGPAAVVTFFVLSGFVLTYRAFRDQETSSLISGAFKRWPRLALPIVTVNVVSGFLLATGLYLNHEVAPLTPFRYLDGFFAGAPYHPWPDMIAAIYEGLFATFASSTAAYFNTVLWTMHFELFGSFLSFAAAALIVRLGAPGLAVAVFATALIASFHDPLYVSFICGVLLARFYCLPEWGRWARYVGSRGWRPALRVALLAAAAATFLGYSDSAATGIYRWLAPLAAAAPAMVRTAAHIAGSIIVIMVVLGTAPKWKWLSGRAAALLGALSFPLYLANLPVICSVGAAAYMYLYLGAGSALAISVTLVIVPIVTLIVSWPLMRLDQWWRRSLRAFERKIVLGLPNWAPSLARVPSSPPTAADSASLGRAA